MHHPHAFLVHSAEHTFPPVLLERLRWHLFKDISDQTEWMCFCSLRLCPWSLSGAGQGWALSHSVDTAVCRTGKTGTPASADQPWVCDKGPKRDGKQWSFCLSGLQRRSGTRRLPRFPALVLRQITFSSSQWPAEITANDRTTYLVRFCNAL